MVVAFELNDQTLTALNGGLFFKFNEAVSWQIFCETQEEIDDYWDKLTPGDDVAAQQWGWLKDKYGLSRQVVAVNEPDLLMDPTSPNSQRAMAAMMNMKKLDIAAMRKACDGDQALDRAPKKESRSNPRLFFSWPRDESIFDGDVGAKPRSRGSRRQAM